MNILVTGANGQLGRTFRDLSVEYGHEFIFTSRNAAPETEPLDVTDAAAVEKILKARSVDVIINCAGYTDVARAESEPDKAFMLNVHAPAALASAAKSQGATIIHISTDYVYDGTASVPYREADAPNPQSVYARTKLEGDISIINSGARYMIFRTSWLYSNHGKNFFKTISKKASEHPAINVVNNQFGTPTYAVDLARAILGIIDNGQLDMNGIYNYSNEGECSWFDFAKAIVDESGYDCEVLPCSTSDYPSPVKRPAYSVLDKALFKQTFNQTIPSWRASLAQCLQNRQS